MVEQQSSVVRKANETKTKYIQEPPRTHVRALASAWPSSLATSSSTVGVQLVASAYGAYRQHRRKRGEVSSPPRARFRGLEGRGTRTDPERWLRGSVRGRLSRGGDGGTSSPVGAPRDATRREARSSTVHSAPTRGSRSV